jgi:hypothetical protein
MICSRVAFSLPRDLSSPGRRIFLRMCRILTTFFLTLALFAFAPTALAPPLQFAAAHNASTQSVKGMDCTLLRFCISDLDSPAGNVLGDQHHSTNSPTLDGSAFLFITVFLIARYLVLLPAPGVLLLSLLQDLWNIHTFERKQSLVARIELLVMREDQVHKFTPVD